GPTPAPPRCGRGSAIASPSTASGWTPSTPSSTTPCPTTFLEFDVLDTASGAFPSPHPRREVLPRLPPAPPPLPPAGPGRRLEEVRSLVRPSVYKSPAWRERLAEAARAAGVSLERAWGETDRSDLSEGLYLKQEEGGRVVARFKFIRASFLTSVLDSGSHWLKRPIIANGLAP